MNIGDLKKSISNMPDDTEVFFRRVAPLCGNIESAGKIELSTYGCFGESVPCAIIEPLNDEEE